MVFRSGCAPAITVPRPHPPQCGLSTGPRYTYVVLSCAHLPRALPAVSGRHTNGAKTGRKGKGRPAGANNRPVDCRHNGNFPNGIIPTVFVLASEAATIHHPRLSELIPHITLLPITHHITYSSSPPSSLFPFVSVLFSSFSYIPVFFSI